MECNVLLDSEISNRHGKQEKLFNNCHLARLQMQGQFLPRFIRLRLPMAEKLTEVFHCMWRKEAIP